MAHKENEIVRWASGAMQDPRRTETNANGHSFRKSVREFTRGKKAIRIRSNKCSYHSHGENIKTD